MRRHSELMFLRDIPKGSFVEAQSTQLLGFWPGNMTYFIRQRQWWWCNQRWSNKWQCKVISSPEMCIWVLSQIQGANRPMISFYSCAICLGDCVLETSDSGLFLEDGELSTHCLCDTVCPKANVTASDQSRLLSKGQGGDISMCTALMRPFL